MLKWFLNQFEYVQQLKRMLEARTEITEGMMRERESLSKQLSSAMLERDTLGSKYEKLLNKVKDLSDEYS